MPPGLRLDASSMHQAGGLEAWDDEAGRAGPGLAGPGPAWAGPAGPANGAEPHAGRPPPHRNRLHKSPKVTWAKLALTMVIYQWDGCRSSPFECRSSPFESRSSPFELFVVARPCSVYFGSLTESFFVQKTVIRLKNKGFG